jgi:uncharacterized membrane protein (DUF106 family)
MEILIYISGLLTTFIAVLLVAAIKINRKYNLLLDSNQHISNISSIQNGEMREQIDDMRLLMVDIQNTMEKDQYERHPVSPYATLYGYQRAWVYIHYTSYRRRYIYLSMCVI